jgi:hypothetical protein
MFCFFFLKIYALLNVNKFQILHKILKCEQVSYFEQILKSEWISIFVIWTYFKLWTNFEI